MKSGERVKINHQWGYSTIKRKCCLFNKSFRSGWSPGRDLTAGAVRALDVWLAPRSLRETPLAKGVSRRTPGPVASALPNREALYCIVGQDEGEIAVESRLVTSASLRCIETWLMEGNGW